ncbi:unnamed protein product [Ilex paraguariensis]|uniref:Uncharacterized protein n=1 Tax=Ilex paraguariensis TaxID=185542 RepID=A0ABC8RGV1_9AQUA
MTFGNSETLYVPIGSCKDSFLSILRWLKNKTLHCSWDALYCEEEHWEEVRENDFEEEEEESYYSDCISPKSPLLQEHDLLWEEEELSSLFSKEQKNPLYNSFQTDPSLAEAHWKRIHGSRHQKNSGSRRP